MKNLIFVLVASLLPIQAFGYAMDSETLLSKHIHTIAVMDVSNVTYNSNNRKYSGALSGCDIDELNSLIAPVEIVTPKRALKRGTVLEFIGADGNSVSCTVEMISKR